MAEAEATPPHLIDIVYRASKSTTLPAGKSMSYLPGEAVPQVLASHGLEQAEWDELLRDLLAHKQTDDRITWCVFYCCCWLCDQCCDCVGLHWFERKWEQRLLGKGLAFTDDADEECVLHIGKSPAEAARSPRHATEAQAVGAPAQCSMEAEDNPVLDWQDNVVADSRGNVAVDAQGNAVADAQGNAVVGPA
eukprot:CAMPEP_0171232906 /NCGR_PEP_ID=MMETSP0790-20130122/40649_1 /TAXON_ID=2925 /ORGANISM="Alexandrium catenella, Strain OF101" /LENGTH=191 /DNA_ID=CAMNT_0011699155 /DNA_START=35 /DNA_END=610 /DNA_ORIENTATION=-